MASRKELFDTVTKALDALFGSDPKPSLGEAKAEITELQQHLDIMLNMIEQMEKVGDTGGFPARIVYPIPGSPGVAVRWSDKREEMGNECIWLFD